MVIGPTGKSDRELFPAFYPEVNELRESTTFNDDFAIADAFGDDAVRDTYKRSFEGWRSDYKYLAELTVVLNKRCWLWYHVGNEARSRLYAELYHRLRGYCNRTLKGDAAQFFFKVLD